MLLCSAIPDYPLAVATRSQSQDDAPVIVSDRYDRGHVIACDRRAHEYGARIAQTTTQAVAAAPQARVLVYDPLEGTQLWSDMLDALDAVTPLIDDAAPGIAYLDMRGIEGDPAAWMQRTRDALARFGMPLRIGVGPNKICAYAATWIADGTIVELKREQAALAPLSLEALNLDGNTLQRLRLLGVSTLGQLAQLPHGPFVRRFGRDAKRWHEFARGIDRTPFVPRGHALAIEAALFGEGHAEEEAQVLFALRVLLARVCGDLERCGQRAGTLRLEVELDNGDTAAFDVGLAVPTADERSMLDVLRAKLDGMTFAAPLIGLRVRALRLEEGGEELALFSGDDIDDKSVAVTLARLEGVLGEPVLRAKTQHAHPIEERFTYEPFALPKRQHLAVDVPLPAAMVPQLRLLTVREIDVRVQRGEPAFVGSPPQAVLECAGPWRVEEAWFTTPVVRDEYDVLLEDGELYRIYRQGTRWYLRGAYD